MSGGAADSRDAMAAAWAGRPGCITLGQAKAILAAAQWAEMSARDLAETVVTMTGAEALDEITPDGFGDLMDRFVVGGFRHPLVPMVTAAQLAALDEARRQVGLTGRQFITVVRRVGDVSRRRRLDGIGFLNVWGLLRQHGAAVPVPGHGFMTRTLMRFVHEAAYRQRMEADALCAMLAEVGGVLRASQLDRRGFLRLMLVLYRRGAPQPSPAPAVAGDVGMVTQAQATLVWQLWLDFGGWKGDTAPAALDAAIGSLLGMEGGVASLTRAGARAVIDRFMVPRLNDRRGDHAEARGRPESRPLGGQVHDGKQRSGRVKRRGTEGRR